MAMRPIEDAQTPNLKGSLAALHRAALRARELAAQTGTKLIVRTDAAVEPDKAKSDAASTLQEDAAMYKDAT